MAYIMMLQMMISSQTINDYPLKLDCYCESSRMARNMGSDMIIFHIMLRYILFNEAIRPDVSAQSLRHDILFGEPRGQMARNQAEEWKL